MLGLFNKTIAKLEDENKQLKEFINIKLCSDLGKIEELEQHKLYYMCCSGASADELRDIMDRINVLKSKMSWTIPNIIISAVPITELDSSQISELQQKYEVINGKNN